MEVLNYKEFKVTEDMLASQGKRFANLILDRIVFYLLALGIGLLLGVIVEITGHYWILEKMQNVSKIQDILISTILYMIYYVIIEGLTSKSIGKMITKTMVVDENGNKIRFEKALYRSLSRLVPFDAFSFLSTPSRGWHDSWTDTYVVDLKVFEEQKEQFNNYHDLGIERND